MIGDLEDPPIIIKSDSGQSLTIAVLALGLAAGSAWLIKSHSAFVTGLLGTALGGIATIAALWRTVRPNILTLSVDSFRYRNLASIRTIPWKDIAEFKVVGGQFGISFVGINYVSGRAPNSAASRALNSGFAGMDETLVTGWELDTEPLCDLLRQALARWGHHERR